MVVLKCSYVLFLMYRVPHPTLMETLLWFPAMRMSRLWNAQWWVSQYMNMRSALTVTLVPQTSGCWRLAKRVGGVEVRVCAFLLKVGTQR